MKVKGLICPECDEKSDLDETEVDVFKCNKCGYEDELIEFLPKNISTFCLKDMHGYCRMKGCECDCHEKEK